MATTTFTKAELAEFSALLSAKLTEAQADLQLLKDVVSGSLSEPGLDTEAAAQLITRQSKFIKHLQAAQTRIVQRTYGICRITGKPISKERLRLVPHATLCAELVTNTTIATKE